MNGSADHGVDPGADSPGRFLWGLMPDQIPQMMKAITCGIVAFTAERRDCMRLAFQKGDILAIGAVILLAVLVFSLFLPEESHGAAYAEIYRDGKLLQTVALDREQEFVLTGKYNNTVTVRDGRVAVTDSDCPGADCVSCGWIGSSGRSIVCLPNGIEIRVVSKTGDVDFVVG